MNSLDSRMAFSGFSTMIHETWMNLRGYDTHVNVVDQMDLE